MKRGAWIVGLILLAATIGVPAWLLSGRNGDGKDAAVKPESLDVVSRGRVDAREQVQSLDPLQAGRVVKVHVAEGAVVKKGDVIVTLDDRIYADQLKNAQLARDGEKLALEAAQEKQKARPAEIESLQKKIDAAAANADSFDGKLRTMREQIKLSDRVPFTQADVESLEAQIRSARLNIESEEIRLKQLKESRLDLEVQAAKLRLDAAEEAVKQAERWKAECEIRAPADGTILRMQVAVGALLAPGMVMNPSIVFVPDGPFVVRAEVDQADLGGVKVGGRVTIKDDSRRDSPEWTGHVVSVAGWISQKKSMLLDPGEFNDVRTLEAVIAVDPSPHKMVIGQRMVVRFLK